MIALHKDMGDEDGIRATQKKLLEFLEAPVPAADDPAETGGTQENRSWGDGLVAGADGAADTESAAAGVDTGANEAGKSDRGGDDDIGSDCAAAGTSATRMAGVGMTTSGQASTAGRLDVQAQWFY